MDPLPVAPPSQQISESNGRARFDFLRFRGGRTASMDRRQACDLPRRQLAPFVTMAIALEVVCCNGRKTLYGYCFAIRWAKVHMRVKDFPRMPSAGSLSQLIFTGTEFAQNTFVVKLKQDAHAALGRDPLLRLQVKIGQMIRRKER